MIVKLSTCSWRFYGQKIDANFTNHLFIYYYLFLTIIITLLVTTFRKFSFSLSIILQFVNNIIIRIIRRKPTYDLSKIDCPILFKNSFSFIIFKITSRTRHPVYMYTNFASEIQTTGMKKIGFVEGLNSKSFSLQERWCTTTYFF